MAILYKRVFRFQTMDSKVMVAAIAIAVVAIIGIGAFLAMNNNDDPAPLDVDEIRTELRVGDHIDFM